MTSTPRVIVSVWGRFHGFDLARELQNHDALSGLITSYPRYAAARFGIARRRIAARPLPEIAVRLARRFCSPAVAASADLRCRRWYERAAHRALRHLDGDVFVGWSGTSLSLVREAKRRGIVTVVERGSSHIVEQEALLSQEYEAFGLRMRPFDRAVIDQELQEYGEADYVAVPSQFVVDSFLRQGFPAARLLLNPYGADLSRFFPAPERHEPFRIIQVGGVSIRKGFHYVIEAFAKAAIPGSELWFVGAVSPEAENFLRENPTPRVAFQGAVPQQDLPRWYNQCDVACLGSIEEGMAMVLLQAAACGLPIVCTENTGGADIVGNQDCGIVVPPRSSDDLAAAFRRLHDDRELAGRMGLAARRRSESFFSWEQYGERAVDNYRRIVAASRTTRGPAAAGHRTATSPHGSPGDAP